MLDGRPCVEACPIVVAMSKVPAGLVWVRLRQNFVWQGTHPQAETTKCFVVAKVDEQYCFVIGFVIDLPYPDHTPIHLTAAWILRMT